MVYALPQVEMVSSSVLSRQWHSWARLQRQCPRGLTPDLALEGRGRQRETYQVTGYKCKCFDEGLKPCQLPMASSHRVTFSLNLYAARIHMHFTFSGENVSLDFLPVYVLMPTTKCLKNRNELLTRNGGQSSKI